MALKNDARVDKAILKARKRGILGFRWGFNPNSSSLAADVSILLLGATAISIFSVMISSWLRIRSRFGGRSVSGTG